MFLEETNWGHINFKFIRFQNQIHGNNKKYIGFEIQDTKEKIYEMLVRSIVSFTIPGSFSTVIYKDNDGHFMAKKYQNHSKPNFYING